MDYSSIFSFIQTYVREKIKKVPPADECEFITLYIPRNEMTSQFNNTEITPLKDDEILLVFDMDHTLYSGSDPKVIAFFAIQKLISYFKKIYGSRKQKYTSYTVSDQYPSLYIHQYQFNEKKLKEWKRWETFNEETKKLILDQSFLDDACTKPLHMFLTPSDDLINKLQELKNSKKKYRFSIFTNGTRLHALKTLQTLKVEHFFETVFCLDDEKDKKRQYAKPSLDSFEMIEIFYQIRNFQRNSCLVFNKDCESVFLQGGKDKRIIFFDDKQRNLTISDSYNWKSFLVKPDDNIADVIDRAVESFAHSVDKRRNSWSPIKESKPQRHRFSV